MDQRDNPYTPGAGIPPPVLAGRDVELENFEILLTRLLEGRPARSQVISGLRGVGKTALLIEFDDMAKRLGWSTSGVSEIPQFGDVRRGLARVASDLLNRMSLKHQAGERINQGLDLVQRFVAAAKGQSVEVSLERGASGDLANDLTDLFIDIGETAQQGGTGALFLLDELHFLDAAPLAAICQAVHQTGQQSLPVAFVGAGLPVLPGRLLKARPYASRLFDYRTLGSLSDPAVGQALRRPVEDSGVTYTDEAVEAIVRLSHGYPYFVQEYGRVLWNEISEREFTADHVDAVQAVVDSALEGSFFGSSFEQATDAEQRYLIAMASLGDEPYSSGDIPPLIGRSGASAANKERQALIEKELIWVPSRGKVAFTLPRFAEYLREHHPRL